MRHPKQQKAQCFEQWQCQMPKMWQAWILLRMRASVLWSTTSTGRAQTPQNKCTCHSSTHGSHRGKALAHLSGFGGCVWGIAYIKPGKEGKAIFLLLHGFLQPQRTNNIACLLDSISMWFYVSSFSPILIFTANTSLAFNSAFVMGAMICDRRHKDFIPELTSNGYGMIDPEPLGYNETEKPTDVELMYSTRCASKSWASLMPKSLVLSTASRNISFFFMS